MAKSKKNSIALVNEILAAFKKKELANLYCFDGEEVYYINRLEEAFENQILAEEQKDFNLNIFYGKDAQWPDIVNVCQQASMFGGMQLVMLKEAADFKDLKELEPYLSKFPPSTHLFIAHKYKKIDGRGSFLKSVKKVGVYERFDKLRDDRIPAWIRTYCAEHNISISDENAHFLALNLGSNLQKIANELEKVQLNLKEGEEVNAEHIERYIGISKDYNIFEYVDALLFKDKTKAYKILNYVIANPKSMNATPLIANLFSVFTSLYAFHKLGRPDVNVLKDSLGVNYYAAQKCKTASSFYNLQGAKQAIYILNEMAVKDRGIGGAVKDTSIHKELVGKLLAV